MIVQKKVWSFFWNGFYKKLTKTFPLLNIIKIKKKIYNGEKVEDMNTSIMIDNEKNYIEKTIIALKCVAILLFINSRAYI